MEYSPDFRNLSIYFFFLSEMGRLIKVATILSFLTAPFYALTNYILIASKHTPKDGGPQKHCIL